MKRATLGGLLRELAMRADEEEEQRTTLARDLSMGGVYASGKLAAASATIASQREEIRDLRARLRHACNLTRADKHPDLDSVWAELCDALDLKNKSWRKP